MNWFGSEIHIIVRIALEIGRGGPCPTEIFVGLQAGHRPETFKKSRPEPRHGTNQISDWASPK